MPTEKYFYSQNRLIFLMLLIITAVLAGVSSYVYVGQKKMLIDVELKKANVELQLIGDFLSDSMVKRDYAEAKMFLDKWPSSSGEEIVYLSAAFKNGYKLMEYKSGDILHHDIVLEKRVDYLGNTLDFKIVKSSKNIHEILERLQGRLVLLSVVLDLLLWFLLWIILNRLAIKPMEREIDKRTEALRRSVTQLEMTSKDLESAKIAAEEANRSKSQFLANMSHEIRTPLNAIIGLTSLIKDDELVEKQKNYLEKIERSSHTLLKIINEILDFSKIGEGKFSITQEVFDLDLLVDGLYSMTIAISRNKDVEVNFSVEENVPRTLFGDSQRIGQILTNLLSNAIKFTAYGKIGFNVALMKEKGEDIVLEFLVEDSGIGMDESTVMKIFDPFTQADGTTTRKYGGTGLGLSISKQLAELMGGELRVTSEIGKGSRFVLIIPLKVTTLEKIDNKMNGRDALGKPFVDKVFKNVRVLLVEDNDINQDVAKGFLERVDVDVVTCNNGKEAIALLEKDSCFDVIFMDIQMPEMDGFVTTEVILKNAQLAHIPIVAMTAGVFEEEKQRCLNAGMVDFISKPIDRDHLYHILAKLLKKHGSTDKITVRDQTIKEIQIETVKNIYEHLEAIDEIDEQDLKNRFGDDAEMVQNLFNKYCKNYCSRFNEIEEAIKNSDNVKALEILHSFKGVALHIGAKKLASLLVEIEKNIKRGSSVDGLLNEAKALNDAITNRCNIFCDS